MKFILPSIWRTLVKTCCLSTIVLLVGCATTTNTYAQQSQIQEFIDQMAVQHDFSRTELAQLFNGFTPDQRVINSMTKPHESMPWYRYRPIFVTDQRAQLGMVFWQQHAETLAYASKKYGVSPEIIVAILGVETRYGQLKGTYHTFNSLATLSFDYPPRAHYFRGELKQYLLLCRELSLNPSTVLSSYAGALGEPQFMPSSYRHYAVCYRGDHMGNLFTSDDDAIVSVAHYFQANGWQQGGKVAVPGKKSVAGGQSLTLEAANGPEYWTTFHNFTVIKRYNTSPLYAMAVYQLSTRIKARYQNA